MKLTKSSLSQIQCTESVRLRFSTEDHRPVQATLTLENEGFGKMNFTDYPVGFKLISYRRGPCGPCKGDLLIRVYPDSSTAETSILRSLKVGDTLTFELGIDGESPMMEAKGLTLDILHLRVARRGHRDLRYAFYTTISTPGSPVRGITFA